MSKAKLTLIGIYNFNDTLFDNIKLPDEINKENVINQLMIEYGELEILFANIDFYKSCIEHFFNINYELFKKWTNTLLIDYDPLDNYNRHEEFTENKGFTNDNKINSSSNGTTTQTNKISSYDDDNFVNDSYNTGSANSSNNSNETNKSNEDITHRGHLWGNIGVTTSQQMLDSEMELRHKWQIEKIICDLFARELLIMVYD